MLFRPMIEMLLAKQGTALPRARRAEPGQSTQCANQGCVLYHRRDIRNRSFEEGYSPASRPYHFMLIVVPVRSVG